MEIPVSCIMALISLCRHIKEQCLISFRNEVMQIWEEAQPLIPLPATFLVFVESDFTPGWPEDLVRGSPGPALLFHRTELQILSMEDLLSSPELPVQGNPAVLLGAITARSPLPGPSYGSGLTSHPPGHSPRGFN